MLWYHQVLSAIGISTNGYALAYIKKKFNLQLSANYIMWLDSLSTTSALTGFLLSGFVENEAHCFIIAFSIVFSINGWTFYNGLNAWSKYKKISTSINKKVVMWKSDKEIIRMAHFGIAALVLYLLTMLWTNTYYELAHFPVYDRCIGTQSNGIWLIIPNLVFVLGTVFYIFFHNPNRLLIMNCRLHILDLWIRTFFATSGPKVAPRPKTTKKNNGRTAHYE